MSSSPTILFVSAAGGNASVMSEFLAERGYSTVTATGLDAFDEAIDNRSLDLVMIDADGLPSEVWNRCARLQEQAVPFFVISQHSDAIHDKGRDYEATRVFEKPLGQDALVQTIQQLLQDT